MARTEGSLIRRKRFGRRTLFLRKALPPIPDDLIARHGSRGQSTEHYDTVRDKGRLFLKALECTSQRAVSSRTVEIGKKDLCSALAAGKNAPPGDFLNGKIVQRRRLAWGAQRHQRISVSEKCRRNALSHVSCGRRAAASDTNAACSREQKKHREKRKIRSVEGIWTAWPDFLKARLPEIRWRPSRKSRQPFEKIARLCVREYLAIRSPNKLPNDGLADVIPKF